jgi:hypothetical protein
VRTYVADTREMKSLLARQIIAPRDGAEHCYKPHAKISFRNGFSGGPRPTALLDQHFDFRSYPAIGQTVEPSRGYDGSAAALEWPMPDARQLGCIPQT